MTALVRIALQRPYTFVVLAVLILIMGGLSALRTPVDIFPEIRIPVIGIVWSYTGLPPEEMSQARLRVCKSTHANIPTPWQLAQRLRKAWNRR